MTSGETVAFVLQLNAATAAYIPHTYSNFNAAEAALVAAGHSIGLAGSDDLWTGTENQLLN